MRTILGLFWDYFGTFRTFKDIFGREVQSSKVKVQRSKVTQLLIFGGGGGGGGGVGVKLVSCTVFHSKK